ncbi:proton-coupled amino acid transporter-like protein CG1139 [Musca domestica]|uniref:Proton-coupled amino acid transporter-like protein CG1139 n=1 Tax=Musca domestica TaxID=7370 RepID=A0A9J7DEB4_MUSDO|nr:proton-coupled amino acid transporter-like protein CG1139 [Musca domestica]
MLLNIQYPKNYDPHQHRYVKYPISNLEAFVSILKCSIGTGCLEMPRAFCHAGWLNGILGTFAIGGIMVYAVHLLIYGMYEICRRHKNASLTFPEAMKIALLEGPPCLNKLSVMADVFVDGFLCLHHFGVCCIYILFVADNIKQIVDHYFYEFDFHIHVLALAGPMIIIFMIRDLKHLIPLNVTANILLLLAFVFILAYIVNDLPPLRERTMINKIHNYPLFFGSVLFAMESIGVIIAIEHEMANPRDFLGFTGVLTLGSATALVFYAAFGFIGYWRFDCQVRGSVTLNMDPHLITSQLVKIMLAIAIFFSYTLQGYVVIDVLWHHYVSKMFNEDDQRIMEYNFRCLLALATVFIAAISPDISVFLPLVGSFCLTILAFVLPALMDLCVNYEHGYGTYNWIFIRDLFLMIFGLCGCITGTWVASNNIRTAFGQTNEPIQSLLYYSQLL